jgi:hypothetical protein
MTIATPSAKSHERVTGRWDRELHQSQLSRLKTPREWFLYYVKIVSGTPIPWLMCIYALTAFVTRAGNELAAWACASLTLVYLLADFLSGLREVRIYRIGGDLFLLCYILIGVASAAGGQSVDDNLATLGGLRWILLLYLMTYCWELFPGLNRIFMFCVGGASLAAMYGIWQHFSGVDLVGSTELASAPVPGTIFFTPIGFFNTPEHLGTSLALILPFPVAAYLLDIRRSERLPRYAALALALLLALGILWTYRPGMWLAGSIGIVIAAITAARNVFKLLFTSATLIAVVLLTSYSSPDRFWEAVEKTEATRSEAQRSQINAQVLIWETSPWTGASHASIKTANYDPGTGNVYFQVLAQTGVLGASFYLLFILGFLLSTYRIFQDVPHSHYWHQVFVAGSLASQITFHIAGLYWSTLSEGMSINLFVLIASGTSYLGHHYGLGIVTDDHAL